MKPTAIDLFCGCGGLTQGLKDAGFRVCAGVELRQEARETYQANHSRTKLFQDVRLVTGDELVKTLQGKPLDLLAACPPCQGFSTLRTNKVRSSLADDRNRLIFQVSRLVEELKPRAVLIENVPALKDDWRMADFRTRLHKLGYRTAVDVLDAADFGVPQRRKRMILIALLGGQGEVFLPRKQNRRKKTVRDAIGKLPPCDADQTPLLHRMRQNLSPLVLERVAQIPKDGGSRRSLAPEHQLKCHQQKVGFNDVYGRMSWDLVAPTLTRCCHNPSKGRFLHPTENRGITLLEAMLLQGFPVTYKFLGTGIGKIASMIGESLPPQLAKAQGEHILGLLAQE